MAPNPREPWKITRISFNNSGGGLGIITLFTSISSCSTICGAASTAALHCGYTPVNVTNALPPSDTGAAGGCVRSQLMYWGW